VEVLRGTFGSANFFVGALGIFPKAVRFARDMQDRDISHVHAQFANHPAVAALIVHRLTGIPFSFTARGSDIHVDRRMLAAKVEAAAFAITVSSFNKDVIVEECGPHAREKIHVVYGGVDLDRLSVPREARPDQPFTILCVSRFEEVKGHACLVEACRLLRERGVSFECHLVGDGPLREQLTRQIAGAGLDDWVVLHGARPYGEILEHLARASVAVLATVPASNGKREGIPNVLKEAMACGLPVVASRISGIPELVENGRAGRHGGAGGCASAASRRPGPAAHDGLRGPRADRRRLRPARKHPAARRVVHDGRRTLTATDTSTLFDMMPVLGVSALISVSSGI
jgi:glycosyltransferase involved in cell wall biosynthesis